MDEKKYLVSVATFFRNTTCRTVVAGLRALEERRKVITRD
jgi:hypothetical protein